MVYLIHCAGLSVSKAKESWLYGLHKTIVETCSSDHLCLKSAYVKRLPYQTPQSALKNAPVLRDHLAYEITVFQSLEFNCIYIV